MKIILKIICFIAIMPCIKYIIDRLTNKKEDIGLDNTYIMCLIGLIIFILL